MWDPASHPGWRGIADIGASNAKVLVSKDTTFPAMLVAKGLLKADQIDTGYTGAPARFITDPSIVQQGYATMEPYSYEREIRGWGKPVRYQLLSDVGYSIYPEALSVRSGDIGPMSACLHRLVPILQQSLRDYLANPGPTNQLVVDTVARYNDGWSYPLGTANYASANFTRLGIIANDSSGPLGGMDPARVRATIDTFAPILSRSGGNVRPGLTAADIATNEFLDPSIRLR
jgi:hypothetical protein